MLLQVSMGKYEGCSIGFSNSQLLRALLPCQFMPFDECVIKRNPNKVVIHGEHMDIWFNNMFYDWLAMKLKIVHCKNLV